MPGTEESERAPHKRGEGRERAKSMTAKNLLTRLFGLGWCAHRNSPEERCTRRGTGKSQSGQKSKHARRTLPHPRPTSPLDTLCLHLCLSVSLSSSVIAVGLDCVSVQASLPPCIVLHVVLTLWRLPVAKKGH